MDWWAAGATALVVPVPEVEPAIGALRRLHSPSGRDGMIAHVTLATPAAPPTAEDLAQIRATVLRRRRFSYRLAELRRFPSALYLAPDPPEPFIALSVALSSHLEVHPVPGGRMIPHVTVASRVDDRVLDELEQRVRPMLPIDAVATRVVLYERGDDLRLDERDVFELDV